MAANNVRNICNNGRIRFVDYRYCDNFPWRDGIVRDEPADLPTTLQSDDGHFHPIGLITQEAEQIDPEWTGNEGTYKQRNAHGCRARHPAIERQA
jgi:hypothetical protein